MLAKDPRFHVTLIEAQDTLLNGASLIASRLHLGGEYPLDPQTALDCLQGAVMWRLLMPHNIYTNEEPMKFLIAQETHAEGLHPDADQATTLTFEKQIRAYENIRRGYENMFHRVGNAYGWNAETTGRQLFGSPRPDSFFRILTGKEFADFPGIVGGIQTREIGFNVPKCLAMIQAALEEEQKKGSITVLTGHRVQKHGILKKDKHFEIYLETNEEGKTVKADQVVAAGWRDSPHMLPEMLGKPAEGKKIIVYQRGMLLIDLPLRRMPPSAFVMLGKHGGMFSRYNDKTAVCYLPTKEGAYRREIELTADQPSLPADWDYIAPGRRRAWTERYLKHLQKRFPFLKEAAHPHIIMRDTLNFQQDIYKRRHEMAEELPDVMSVGEILDVFLEHLREPSPQPLTKEEKHGLFTLCPTKATYAVNAALQVAEMVKRRSLHPEDALLHPVQDSFSLINTPEKRQAWSLELREPNVIGYTKFFRQHPDLDPQMMEQRRTKER